MQAVAGMGHSDLERAVAASPPGHSQSRGDGGGLGPRGLWAGALGVETLSCLVQVSPRTALDNQMLTKGPTPTCFPGDPPERPPAGHRASSSPVPGPHTACSQRGRALETFLPGVREDAEGQAGPGPEGTGPAALRLGTQQGPEAWARTRAPLCASPTWFPRKRATHCAEPRKRSHGSGHSGCGEPSVHTLAVPKSRPAAPQGPGTSRNWALTLNSGPATPCSCARRLRSAMPPKR